jgi:D-aminopeptidase
MFVLRLIAAVSLSAGLAGCWEVPVNRGDPGVYNRMTACAKGAEYVKAAKAAGQPADCKPAEGGAHH